MTMTERIEVRIVELEQEVEILQAQIAGLRQILDDEDRDAGNAAAPAPTVEPADDEEEDDPPAPPLARSPDKARANNVSRESKLRVARTLAGGPLTRAEIEEKSGLSAYTVNYALADLEWFEKEGTGGRGSPWQLTPKGRAALDGSA